MVRVGLVGIGFMGWIHYLAYQRSKEAQLVGFASRDEKKRSGDWRGIKGNFGPPGEQINVDSLNRYSSLKEMLADDSIDVVDICLPPHLHVDAAIESLEHGKHVLCEKPLALTAKDCDQILDAAKRNNRMVMVAHVLPFIGPFAYVLELVKSEQHGRAIGGYFKRIISNPDWIPDFYDPDRVGGPMIDLHVHDTHFIQMLFGQPTSVCAIGSRKGDVAKYAQVIYRFDNPQISVGSTSGVIDSPARPFTHGFEVQFEKATVQFDFAAYADGVETLPLKVLTASGEVIRPELASGDEITAFEGEVAEMTRVVDEFKKNVVNNVAPSSGSIPVGPLSGKLARDAIYLAECIQESVLSKRPVDLG